MSTQTTEITSTTLSKNQQSFSKARKYFVFGILAVLIGCLGFSALVSAGFTAGIITTTAIIIAVSGFVCIVIGAAHLGSIIKRAIND